MFDDIINNKKQTKQTKSKRKTQNKTKQNKTKHQKENTKQLEHQNLILESQK